MKVQEIRSELPLNWGTLPRNHAALERGRAMARRRMATAKVAQAEDALVEIARKGDMHLFLVQEQQAPIGIFLMEGADFPAVRQLVERAREEGRLAAESSF